LISAGSRLGPYEIAAQLGAGGMGEVYRARDSRLDRTVAIKILPQRLSADPRLRERFEREAKAISALSHPHICTLYDVGSHDGTDFLVMEYLDGESLAERLSRGPLPIEQVLRYGTEIAEALDKAHRSGVVHRDLKPGNIVLTKSGAKLLDFGLAKFAQPALMNSDPNAATAAMSHQKPLTEEGTILGTFQYMAPEQIEARDADPRTDIFAFGAVLYEMATGKRAFEAKTKASLIASILDRDPPPISTIQPLTPVAFERVVRLCLAKDPDERWQSAHDVAAELKWIGTTSSETIGPGAKRRSRKMWLRAMALLATGLLIGALATWLVTRQETRPARVARFTVNTAPNAPLALTLTSLGISPDGNYVVYRALHGGTPKLYLRAVGNLPASPIAGTDGVGAWTFSPDGRWIAYTTDEALMKIPREGGTPTRMTDDHGLGIDWHGDTIVINKSFSGGLYAIPADGGEARQIVKSNAAKKENAIVWPDVLPGGKHVIATVWSVGAWDTARIIAYSMTDGSSKVLIDGGYFGRYSPTGHLLFMRGNTLMAVAFDPETLTVGSSPAAVLNGIAHGTSDGEGHYATSEAGHLIYASGGATQPNDQLVWIDRTGKAAPMVPTLRRYGSIDLSPDGRTAAVTIEESTYDIWQLDLERDSLTRVSHGGDDLDAVWTADGNRVIWTSSRSGAYNLYWRAADNSSAEERISPSNHDQFGLSVTADGKYVLYQQRGSNDSKLDIWIMSLETRTPQLLIATEHNELKAVASPDGRWLAYVGDQSGRAEVFITSFPKPSGSWPVSVDGGNSPRWMPDSSAIVYQNGGKYFVVPIEAGPRPRAGKPRLLFEGPYDDEYCIARDGRIAVIKEGPMPTAAQFTIALNWAEELKRRVPVP
jgi:Tol biopolymer transport system component/tRNA A-37 threonylcarbamoyl transferase component Bud32